MEASARVEVRDSETEDMVVAAWVQGLAVVTTATDMEEGGKGSEAQAVAEKEKG